jgi:hypothetical protein
MKFQALSVAALASLASAVAATLDKRDSPLDVSLEITGNTAVKATIKNTGSEDLKLFKTGTFLDDSHVEKVEVFQAGDKIAFDGIRLRVSTANLDESAFQVLKAGETIEAAFDIAIAHDVSAGGDFDIVTEGAFAYAELDSTAIAGAVPFTSNKVSAAVDGAQAGKIRRDYIEMAKRTVVQSDCTGTRRSATTTAHPLHGPLQQPPSTTLLSSMNTSRAHLPAPHPLFRQFSTASPLSVAPLPPATPVTTAPTSWVLVPMVFWLTHPHLLRRWSIAHFSFLDLQHLAVLATPRTRPPLFSMR